MTFRQTIVTLLIGLLLGAAIMVLIDRLHDGDWVWEQGPPRIEYRMATPRAGAEV